MGSWKYTTLKRNVTGKQKPVQAFSDSQMFAHSRGPLASSTASAACLEKQKVHSLKCYTYWGFCLKNTYSNNLLFPRINYSHFLVFGSRADQTAIPVPADIVNHVGMHVVQVYQGFPGPHVPDDDGVITA